MTKSESLPVYVAKGTQVLGPLTPAQVEELRSSRKIEDFDWIWDPSDRIWNPVMHRPPPPEEPGTQVVQSLEEFAAEVKGTGPSKSLSSVRSSNARPDLLGICYDPRNVLSGTITRYSESGCEFTSPEVDQEPAPFRNGSIIHLNLLDPNTKKSETLPVHLKSCVRRTHGYELTLEWKAVPNLVLAPPSA